MKWFFFQAAEIERDRLKGINMALQQRLADYLHKRKVKRRRKTFSFHFVRWIF